MTRTACLSTISCAALLLAITGYGCGGASDSLPGAGTGGKTGNTGSGGSFGGGTGGIFGGGTGGADNPGSGGAIGGGSGGQTGERDASADGQRPDGRQRPDGINRPDAAAMDAFQRPDGRMRPDAIARDIVARDLFTRPEVAGADGGIPMCRANARCTVGNPPATCMEPCMIGTAAGERACTCVRPGIVTCGQCRRAADGGAADSAGQ